MVTKLRFFGPVSCAALLLFGAVLAVSDDGGNSGPGRGGDDNEEGGNPVIGRAFFLRENCYGCHGGRAGGGMCPNLRDDRPDFDDVREVVREGTPTGMPSFPELSDQNIRDIAAYFKSLRTPAEPTFTHWWDVLPPLQP